MKKRLLGLVIAGLSISLIGCSNAPKKHVHKYDTENIEWYWRQLQNKDYDASATFYCTKCKEDVKGHSITVTADVAKENTRPATCSVPGLYTYTATVTFEGATYSEVKTREYQDESAHHYVQLKEERYQVSEADCEHDAVYYYVCDLCEHVSSETYVDVGSKLGHDLQHKAAKTSTCQEHGYIEHYECNRCGKFLLEEDGEAVSEDEVILPLSHNMTYHPGSEATCTQDGTLDYYTCAYEEGVKYHDEEGEHQVESDDDLIEHALGHEFNDNRTCIRCEKTFEQAYELDEATTLDGITPISLSDLNINDGATVPAHTSSHLYGNYDFNGNKGIDLWFKPQYQKHTDDAWGYFYLFNKHDESGIVFRFQYNRTQDDGVLPLMIYTANGYGAGTTVTRGAGTAGTYFCFPATSGIKSTTDNLFHVTAYCVDETTNLYRCAFTGGVVNGTQYYPSTSESDTSNTPLTFDIELGANYFTGSEVIRFSSSTNDLKLYGYEIQEDIVVYKDIDGSFIGKKAGTVVHAPKYNKLDKKLIGWFDQKGNKVTEGQQTSGKTIVQPIFVDEHEDMIVPSDIQLGEKGEWFDVNGTTVTEETASGIGYVPTSNRVDLYFIYQSTAFTSSDRWSKFGFPYDFVDAKSRLFIRINENNDGRFEGFVFGGSLGNEGDPGTYYNLGNAFRKQGDNILIHLTVIDNGNNSVLFTLEATNLRTRVTNFVNYNVTFTQYSMSEGADRNKMALLPAVKCEWRFIDAF